MLIVRHRSIEAQTGQGHGAGERFARAMAPLPPRRGNPVPYSMWTNVSDLAVDKVASPDSVYLYSASFPQAERMQSGCGRLVLNATTNKQD
jgi:hypothetical protein